MTVDHVDADVIRHNVAELRARIDRLGDGRQVHLIAVTKGFGAQAIEAAVNAGCHLVGESYAQEMRDKWPNVNAVAKPEVHFIGQLQRNKVRLVADHVDVWESVDRQSLADEIAKRSPGARIYIQVDATSEEGKGGAPIADVAGLVAYCTAAGLRVEGLMTVGPTSAGPVETRRCFRSVRQLADELGLTHCSMGMSGDLDIAIEEGSTHVRIGTAIFGERPRQRG